MIPTKYCVKQEQGEKMKLWIIYSKTVLSPTKSNALSWMLEEAKKLDFDAEIIFSEDLYIQTSNTLEVYHQGQMINKPDLVLMRCYDLPLIEHLELMEVKVYNTHSALRDCMDKFKTHQLLVSAGIPTPKTLKSAGVIDYHYLIETLGLPFIIKNNKGSRGTQVYLIHSEIEYTIALKNCSEPIYQAYINSSYGQDIRVHVIGGEFITCLLRKSEDDFKSNFSLGGQALPYEANDQIKKLAIESAKALNLDFAGIDILIDDQGYTICEVNGIPGFRTVGLTSKVNIPELMLTYIRSKI